MHRSFPPYQPSLSTIPFTPHYPLRWPPAVDRITRILTDRSGIYLVGGVVRDTLLGLPISDLDLVTVENGLHIARLIADNLGGDYYPIDKERGTGRALVESDEGILTVDVATFRGPDLLADLQERDFTINAIASPLSEPGKIIDPLDGEGDLLVRRVLRQCTESSLFNDPVRALRAVRSSLIFSLRMMPETIRAVRMAATLLGETDGLFQPERVRDELFKLLSQTDPASALRLLITLELLDVLLPFPRDAETLVNRLNHVERFSRLLGIIGSGRDDNMTSDVILGLAVMVLDRWRSQLQEHLNRKLSGDHPYPVLAILAALTPANSEGGGQLWQERFHLSNDEAHVIGKLIVSRTIFPSAPPVDARTIHRYYRALGETGVTGVLLGLAQFLTGSSITGLVDPVKWSGLLNDVASPLLDAYFRHHQQIVSPPPLLTGNELMQELSLSPGPAVGQLLAEVLEAQAAGEVRTRIEALALASHILTTL